MLSIKRAPLLSLTLLFLLLCSCKGNDIVTDIDGNVYPVITIGKQVWMAQNLFVTQYRNGESIRFITDNLDWSQAKEGAYCMYNNDTAYGRKYGRLYNWYAVNDSRNIAPEGWHIPTMEEIAILVNTLKGDTAAGGLMKATTGWLYPNAGAGNASGFSALPGGYRYGNDGTFHTLGSNGYWWHTTGSYELFAWSQRFYNYFADIKRDPQYFTYGFSVRCIKDK